LIAHYEKDSDDFFPDDDGAPAGSALGGLQSGHEYILVCSGRDFEMLYPKTLEVTQAVRKSADGASRYRLPGVFVVNLSYSAADNLPGTTEKEKRKYAKDRKDYPNDVSFGWSSRGTDLGVGLLTEPLAQRAYYWGLLVIDDALIAKGVNGVKVVVKNKGAERINVAFMHGSDC